MYQIQKILTAETFPIRKEVLRKGMDLPVAFNGDANSDTFHLGAFFKGQLSGVSSFMIESNRAFNGVQYQLRGMATLQEFRAKGVGKLMLNEAENLLKDMNVAILWCNARVSAVPFYQKQGFTCVGGCFQIETVGPHYVMFKTILNEKQIVVTKIS